MPESSPELETAAQAATDVQTPAESSTVGAQSEGVKSVLDIVRETTAKSEETAPASEGAKAEGTADPSEDGAKPDLGEIPEDEQKFYSQRAQQRIHGLVAERNAQRERVAELEGKTAELDNLTRFVRENRLEADDLTQVFDIAATLKNNPAAAREKVAAILATIDNLAGNTLPTDLKEEVRLGYLTEQRALELSRARAGQQRSEGQLKADRDARAEAERQSATQRLVETAASATDKWEAGHKAKDPDWNLKQTRVSEIIQLAVHNKGFPKSGQEAVAMADEALAKVNAEFKKLMPSRKQMTPITGQASTQAARKPTSILDIINQETAKAR